jgi:hypothetical protein
MADEPEIDRTSATGLFNTARSWWRSGVELDALAVKGITHPGAPVTFLLCHAIELYLKAFLRSRGRDLAFLKRIGHRVADLAKVAVADGLSIDVADMELLSHVEDADVAMESRYIVTGFKGNVPTSAALAEVAERLDRSACQALSKAGFAVREQTFEAPVPPSDLSADTLRVLIYMFKSNEIGDQSIGHAIRMEMSLLRYHLDFLMQADLVDTGGGNYRTGERHYHLTTKGRRYVVERKLHEN